MALNEQQKALLDQMKSDPAFRKAAAAFVLADEQSKKLDEAGVNRKSVDSASDAQYAHGPNGLFNQPGTGKAQKAEIDGKFINPAARNIMDLVLGENPTVTDDTEPKPDEELKAEGEVEIEVEDTEEETMPEGSVQEDSKKKSVSLLTFEDLTETVKEYTENSINKALVDSPVMREVVGVISKAINKINALEAEIAELRSGEIEIKKQYETPRYILKRMLGLNEVSADDPLVKKSQASTPIDPDNVFQSVAGFSGQ